MARASRRKSIGTTDRGKIRGPRPSVLAIFFHGAFRLGTSLLRTFLFFPLLLPGPAGQGKIEAPQPKQTSAHTAFAEAKRLAQLETLAAKQPDAKELAHELGVVYYKKGDYWKAVASFQTAKSPSCWAYRITLQDGQRTPSPRSRKSKPQLERGRRIHPWHLLHADQGLLERA